MTMTIKVDLMIPAHGPQTSIFSQFREFRQVGARQVQASVDKSRQVQSSRPRQQILIHTGRCVEGK